MTPWLFAPLPRGHYGAILIDPPWWFRNFNRKGSDKSAENHYRTMPLSEILALPVGELAAKNCALFMWATWPFVPEALLIMSHWGFDYKTGGAWRKRTRNGKDGFGTGHIFRSACEPYIVGTVGKPRWWSKSVRNLIDSPLREHSRKPPEIRKDIKALLPHVPAVEIFTREPWPGNDVWGDEANKFAVKA